MSNEIINKLSKIVHEQLKPIKEIKTKTLGLNILTMIK